MIQIFLLTFIPPQYRGDLHQFLGKLSVIVQRQLSFMLLFRVNNRCCVGVEPSNTFSQVKVLLFSSIEEIHVITTVPLRSYSSILLYYHLCASLGIMTCSVPPDSYCNYGNSNLLAPLVNISFFFAEA